MTPTQPIVSVVMPAYNVDRYIRRAVESLQNQTLRNFELLVVDDGSSDRTGQILDSMAERDYRIIVYHNENGGAPAARNYALDRARGTYVYFMDADDWIEPRMLEDMVSLAGRSRLDLVITGFYIDTYYGDAGEHTEEIKSRPNALYPTQQEFRAAAWQLFDQNLFYTPWNKLFLRDRIEDLHVRFRPTFMDDFPFVLDYIRDVERVGVLEYPYYHFIRERAESETARWRPDLYEKREEEHGWMLDLYKHWGLDGDASCMEMIQRRYIERLIGCIENVCNPACELSTKEKIAQIDTMITSDRAQLAVAMAHPRSRMMKAMLVPIKAQNARMAYHEGKIISHVKRHNTKIFATLKANR
ncbi:MAG: glycosyltransferase family 2 protein [Atopobiaceae bacterium]|nr:glycosyltransferase family 2 protein [Atopobiaceae bacterium]